MQKRGAAELLFLFSAVIGVIVSLVVMKYAGDIASNKVFVRQNMADDVALAVNTLESAQGKTEYYLNRNTSSFLVKMEQDSVEVTQSGEGLIEKTVQKATESKATYVPRLSAPEFKSIADHEPVFWIANEGNIIKFSTCEGVQNDICFSAEDARKKIISDRLETEIISAMRECATKQGDNCVCGSFSASLLVHDSKIEFKNSDSGTEINYKQKSTEAKENIQDTGYCEYQFLVDGSAKNGVSATSIEPSDDDEIPNEYLFGTLAGVKVPILIKSGNKVCLASHLDPEQYAPDYVLKEDGIRGAGGILTPMCT
ncbi:MAG: hypothetical protein EPN86_03655 [Nanoarchaeota archaeon]|nr:MAG: hypothetical protein EPN86_03655 [Nanoarchaeota archaeon]